jgi:tail sheath protein
VDTAVEITSPAQFAEVFGPAIPEAYLAHAVLGFFENGGRRAWVVRAQDEQAGLDALGGVDDLTTVCVPDAAASGAVHALQREVSAFSEANAVMAILDAPPAHADPPAVGAWVAGAEGPPRSRFATLYWPWITVADPLGGAPIAVPPCGHVAGLWARTDEELGVFKAPANQVLRGALGLAYDTNDAEQAPLTTPASTASGPSRGGASWSGVRGRSRSRPSRSGGTSTSAGSSPTSARRSSKERSGPSSSRTTGSSGSACRPRSPGS